MQRNAKLMELKLSSLGKVEHLYIMFDYWLSLMWGLPKLII